MDFINVKPNERSPRNAKNAHSLSDDVGRAIHRGLSELYHEDICADFEIIVGNQSFRCHRVVLAAVSDYFRAMFTSGMTETIKNQTTFEDISPKVFKVILNMIYPDNDVDVKDGDDLADLSEEEMSELLRVADMLQMKFLLEKCCSYLKITMTPTNCIERWQMAKSILNTEISEFAWNFLLRNFEKVVTEKMLLTLEIEDFHSVIVNENLCVVNEADVWKAIYEWIKFDETKRKVHLTNLLKECCLTELEENVLIEEIVFDPLIREDDDAAKLIQEAVRYRRHPALQGSMEMKLRKNAGKERMLVLIYKKKAEKLRVPSEEPGLFSQAQLLYRLNASPKKSILTMGLQTIFKREKRQTLITVRPVDGVRGGLAFCVHGDSLFVSSGQKLLKYIAADDTWSEREETPVPLRDHMMCASDEYLFVVGGMSGTSVSSQVLKYNLQEDTWNITGEIMVPVCHASSVCIKDKIYIFGGKMDDGQLVDSVQEFDIRNDTSTILGHLPTPCKYSRAVNKGDIAYIVTSNGQVIQFSAINHKIDVVATLDRFRRVDFGIEMRDGAIHIHGGGILVEDGDEDEDEIGETEEFASTSISVDLTSGKIENNKTFPFPMQVFGCASVIMSTKAGSTRINSK